MSYKSPAPRSKAVAVRTACVDKFAKNFCEDLNKQIEARCIQGKLIPVAIHYGYDHYLAWNDRVFCTLHGIYDETKTILHLTRFPYSSLLSKDKVIETFKNVSDRKVTLPKGLVLPKILQISIKPDDSPVYGKGFRLVVLFDNLLVPSYEVSTNYIAMALSSIETRAGCHFSNGSFNEVFIFYPLESSAEKAVERLKKICSS